MNMKFKKFALVLAIVLMAGTLTPAFASPFADVPADHWAYDAIVQLAAAGLIEGYPMEPMAAQDDDPLRSCYGLARAP